MRKKSINNFFDSALWYLVYMLPLVCFVLLLFKTGNPVGLGECMSSCGLGILTDNVVYTALNSIFGTGGVLPLFMSADILLYFSYFICVWICHLAVDILLWIVRYAHKLMDNFGG